MKIERKLGDLVYAVKRENDTLLTLAYGAIIGINHEVCADFDAFVHELTNYGDYDVDRLCYTIRGNDGTVSAHVAEVFTTLEDAMEHATHLMMDVKHIFSENYYNDVNARF
jgi:hypothetical protein